MEKQNGQRSHVVEDAVSRVLAGRGITEDSVTEEIMVALEELRVVSYQREGQLPLLTVAGRTLVVIMEHPDLTLREMAVRLGTAEQNVSRAVVALSEHGLVTRSRIGRRNHYRVEADVVLGHPDVWRLLAAVEDECGVMTNVSADL